MDNETRVQNPTLHTLIPLADFKAILGFDDREDALSRYCLITATYTIEQYCKRRLLRRKSTDYLTFTGEHIFTLREYPVRRVLAVHAVRAGVVLQGETLFTPENLVDPKHYFCIPDEGIHENIPFSLVLRPPLRLSREEMGIQVRYLAGPENSFESGDFFRPHAVPHYPQTRSMFRVQYWAWYAPGKAPADLASACLELAAGPKPFVVNMENFLAPRRAALFIYTLNVSRALLGMEHEPLPGASPANR
jgi:hypothetical protein